MLAVIYDFADDTNFIRTSQLLHQLCIRVADDTNFTLKSQLLHQLYIREKHYMISTITSTQVYKQMSPIVKKNTTNLFIYRLRNHNDLESIVEELSAIYDKKTFYRYIMRQLAKNIVSFM